MKRTLLFASLLLTIGTALRIDSNAQNNSPTYNEQQWLWMEQFMGIQEKDSVLQQLYHHFKRGEYQTVLDISKHHIAPKSIQQDYLAFYIASLYELGKRDSARAGAKIYIYNKAKGDFALNDLFLFAWYPCFYNIGSDSIINRYVHDAYVKDYKTVQHPNTKLGLQLIDLYYQDQAIRHILNHDLMKCSNEAETQQAKNNFSRMATANSNALLKIYQQHPNYITEQEVGKVSSFQKLLIWHFGGRDSTSTEILFPILKQAMEQKHITPDEFVDQVTQKYFRDGNHKKRQEVRDSLCKIYGCTSTVIYNNE